MLKNANMVPSTKATAMISANCALPAATAAASPPSASARTTSETIMIRLRSRRSASSPAGRTKSGYGRMPANATRPAFAGEWVSESVSSG